MDRESAGREWKKRESVKSENENRIVRMETEAMQELLHYYEKNTKQKLKDMVKKAAGRYVPPKDLIFWPTGLLANALMERVIEGGKQEAEESGHEHVAAQKSGKRVDAIGTCFSRWIRAGMPIYCVDDALCGTALIDLYLLTREEKYKVGADKMAEYLFLVEQRHADAIGSIPYRPAQGNGHIYVDGIGMMCPFLAKYGVTFGNEKTIRMALKQIENMLAYGMDAASGLPYHGFQYENGVKYGIIGWGRAVGWLMLGIAGVICALRGGLQSEDTAQYQAECKQMENAFWGLVQAIIPYQKPNGAFGWQLPAMEGPEDSSATAMIAWALQMVTGGTNVKKVLSSAAAYLAACEKDGKIYNCSGECLGFAQYPQVYGAYPWSLGPAYAVLAGNPIEPRRRKIDKPE